MSPDLMLSTTSPESGTVPPIRVEGLGKRYRIGLREERPDTLVEVITSRLKAPFRSLRNLYRLANFSDQGAAGDGLTESADVMWALRDVSFEVAQGEVLGMVGANGAGKSTLLKILARITEPSEGRIWLRGRVASLLEVGTGFHPELSGRENVYLNGTILGMSKDEVDSKFDEIVDFAGVDRFIDTPIKRYSSGMKLRLAFSVAAHLEAEIVLVDEVLAVGDVSFQRKCMNKMREVARAGRTVILVSHDMAAVRLLCDRVLQLDGGRIVADGEAEQVVDNYVAAALSQEPSEHVGDTRLATIESVRLHAAASPVIKTGSPFEIEVTLRTKEAMKLPGLYVALLTQEHVRLSGLDLRDFLTPEPLDAGATWKVRFSAAAMPLMPGNYLLEIYVKEMAGPIIERVERWVPFQVVETAVYGRRQPTRWHGLVALSATASAQISPASTNKRDVSVDSDADHKTADHEASGQQAIETSGSAVEVVP